ncbi:MAG: fructokinase [Oceanicoccus sp.]|jgi:fructokinase
MFKVGIDIGGTKIETLALSTTGEELFRRRIATPDNNYEHLLSSVSELVSFIDKSVGSDFSLGVGAPGSVSALTGAMKNCNSTCINGQYLQRDLERRLKRPVIIANDANCFALSESIDGSARGESVVFGVILGTGVGGGLVVNDHLIVGPNAIGSEWGHNLLPGIGTEFDAEERLCYCGRLNCIETYLSGPGLVKTYQKYNRKTLSAKRVVQEAAAGTVGALQSIELYQRQLAYGLSQVVNILDPDVIVLGGGISNIQSTYEVVPKLWKKHIFSDTVNTRLVAAEHGDSSGVRGAVWLAKNR